MREFSFATLWMINTLFLTLDNDRYSESLDEYFFYDRLNGRDYFPDAVQGEVCAFLGPIADDEIRRMMVDARAARASEQESRGLPGRFAATLGVER